MHRKRSALLDETPPRANRVGDVPAEPLDSTASAEPGGVVAQSWGVLTLPPRQVRELLAEEDGLFDS